MKKFSILLFLLSIYFQAISQKDSYFKRVFVDAEYFLLYEEYKDALPLYLEIQNSHPDNSNINYRIGQCYLNIHNEKSKSIAFFEKAILNVSDKYKEGYYTETKAPREAFLLYGIALRSIGNLEKAQRAFVTYRSMLNDKDKAEKILVDKEIESIGTAFKMLDNPKNYIFKSVGRNINSRFPEINPLSVSGGNILIFTSLQRFYNAILQSELQSDFWANPINLNSQTMADGDIQTVGLSSNGSILILSRNDNDDYNLYSSTYDKSRKTWTSMSKLPKEINTRSWETFGSLSQNGDSIFFSSNKEGGYGGFDLYLSVKNVTGEWSQPLNLGPEINTPFDETAPFVTENGKRLFFSSKGHDTMGGFDIVFSNLENKVWGKPNNPGFPLNTFDDDTYFFPIGNGDSGYISRILSDSEGEEDIYLVTLLP